MDNTANFYSKPSLMSGYPMYDRRKTSQRGGSKSAMVPLAAGKLLGDSIFKYSKLWNKVKRDFYAEKAAANRHRK